MNLRYKNKINEDDLIRNEVENCKFLEIVNGKYDLDRIIDKRIKRKKKEYYEKSRYDFEGDRKIKNYEGKRRLKDILQTLKSVFHSNKIFLFAVAFKKYFWKIKVQTFFSFVR